VSNERDGTVTLIDTRTNSVLKTIQVGARPRGIRLSPDQRSVYVAVSYPYQQPSQQQQSEAAANVNKIVAIDVASDEVVATYDAGDDPENFEVSRDGARFYIANEDAGTASVVDLKTNRILQTLVVGAEPEGVALSPDGRWVYVTSETSSSVSVIDTHTNLVQKTFLVDARPRDAIFSPDSARLRHGGEWRHGLRH
jgi:YVTN family beta-propeller protein